MNIKRKQATMYGLNDLRVESGFLQKEMGPNDVIVNVKSVGICGSDLHFLHDGGIGSDRVKPPFVLGHECAGQIIRIGKNVKTLKIGDRVAVEPGVPCGSCEFCLKGKYNLCREVVFLGCPHPQDKSDGAYAEYIVHPAAFCYKLPDNVSYDEGAMMEPLSVALQAFKNGNFTAGMSVCILGCGAIGLTLLLTAKAYGASEIFMTDVEENRLLLAKNLGADYVFNACAEYISKINKLTQGRGIDTVIDAAGNEKSYKEAVEIIIPGGTLILVGMNPESFLKFNFGTMMYKELKMVGVFRYDNVYKKAIKMVSSGAIDIKKIITHRFSIDNINEAFETIKNKKDHAIKAIVYF